MRLALFSYNVTKRAAKQVIEWVGKEPKEIEVAYITTAANTYSPNADWLLHTKRQLQGFGFKVENFDLEKAYKDKVDLEKYFSNKDVIFVSGGNSFYLMYWINKTKFDELLIELLKEGKVYAGASAGTVCLVDNMIPMGLIDKPELAPKKISKGLGIVKFAPIPHWGVEKYQKKLGKIKKKYEDMAYKTFTISDDEALFVDGKKVVKVEK